MDEFVRTQQVKGIYRKTFGYDIIYGAIFAHVDLNVVFETLKNDIPELLEMILK